MVDLNLLERSFEVVGSDDMGAGVVGAFQSSQVQYCVIGNQWKHGGHGLLLSRDRLIGDVLDDALDDQELRMLWKQALDQSPVLLSTLIIGGVLKEIPGFDAQKTSPLSLTQPMQYLVNGYLSYYLGSAKRARDLRAVVVDVMKVAPESWQPRSIAMVDGKIVGVFDEAKLGSTAWRHTVARRVESAPALASRPIPAASAPVGGSIAPASPVASPAPAAARAPQPAQILQQQPPFIAHPRIDAKGPAQPGKTFHFDVGLADHPDAEADEQKRIKLDEYQADERLVVIVSALGATIVGPTSAELPLSLTASHLFKAKVARGVKSVGLHAQYFFRGKPVGGILKTIAVGQTQASTVADSTSDEPPLDVDLSSLPGILRSDENIAGIDLALIVEDEKPGWISWRAYVPAQRKVHGPYAVKMADAERFAKQLASLRSTYGDSGPDAREQLNVTGRRIADCIPKKIIADAIRPALSDGRTPTILLMTDQAFVPWELARLGAADLGRKTPAFLGEVACIGRWWTGSTLPGPQSSRSIQRMSAVAASEYRTKAGHLTLQHAREEREWLHATYGAQAIEAKLPEVSAWLDTSPRPAGHLGHIALHGFSDATADAQGLILGDGKVLTPYRLAGEYDEGEVPRFEIVFLNACQVGTAGEHLSRIGGFPGALLSSGASGFIAPLWEVQDEVACTVAQEFYRRALDQKSEIGEAMRTLRAERDSSKSITPWAYLYYGHPRLQLTLASTPHDD